MADVPNPIHPSFIDKLDPEYVEFHLQHLASVIPPDTLPWDPSIRNAPAVPGGSDPLPVGRIDNFDLLPLKLRAFTPPGEPPEEGWPVFIFFHGGGWTLGSIDSENSFCTRMCIGVRCVVITVDYRLAPEDPYPAAVEDAVTALHFAINPGISALNLNLNKLAVGGSSSGGNLAAILAIKAKELGIPIVFQLLIVPVTDNTATVEDRWKENQNAPWLTPARMMWFRKNYLPNKTDWSKWDASPLFTPTDLMKGLPPAWIAVAERDILCDEGIAYANKLQEAGVAANVQVYKSAPHPILAMDGALQIGKQLVADAADALKKAFE